MKSTFWMTAQETENELERRKGNSNYPFSAKMQFCSKHTRDSHVIDVDQCTDCVKPGYEVGHPLYSVKEN